MKASHILAMALAAVFLVGYCAPAAAAPQASTISGEIQRIQLNPPAFAGDVWMGGSMVVGGQSVTIPRNLLLDLPANRLTLFQIFQQAPAACVTAGESGLAKADTCISVTGRPTGFATISANVMDSNNVIAGDVLIEKGKEIVAGKVTYISYAGGWFRVNGRANNANTGTMVRLNDPSGRHTVQKGRGCLPVSGRPNNCSPDPRFTLDPDNYTAAYVTGYPVCIPSTAIRNFTDVLDFNGNTNTTEVIPAAAAADGTGDLLCPDTNRTVNLGRPVADSRRFAPLRIGDNVTAEGNFELIAGTQFLSAHTLAVADALTTRTDDPNQPDYMFIEEAIMDVPGFNNGRARSLFIGFTTVSPADVMLWTIHRDPKTNAAHEFPLGSVVGCDAIGGPGTCGAQGITPGGSDVFKVRYDVDFTGGAAKPEMSPCGVINADDRFAPVCGNTGGTIAQMFGILSPIPREIQARTGRKFANPTMLTLDILGKTATNGQYLFPFGINLGGIEVPNFFEIDLNRIGFPTIFEGLPWVMDRRLSPGGCAPTGCEATAQPANPFPISGVNPSLAEPSMPTGQYNDAVYTATILNNVRNRTLSFVDDLGGGTFNFNGDSSLLVYPPAAPPARAIPLVAPVTGSCVLN
ncbi:MAG: hypothetical protein WAW37_15450 [Syntrophobacteraceae bacterium]